MSKLKKFIIIIFLSFISSCLQKKTPEVKTLKKDESLLLIKNNNSQSKNLVINSKENSIIQKDTLIKKSEVFLINGLKCYWELKLLIYKGNDADVDGKLILKNKLSSKNLLTNSDYYSLNDSWDTNSFKEINFKSLNIDAIKDVNFDGHKDIMIKGKSESGSAGMFCKIYIFNNKKKIFELSKKLSGYGIEIDSINKTVSYYAKNGAQYNVTQIVHFYGSGKIKYSEVTERENIGTNGTSLFKITYKKVIDDKVMKTKIDTVQDY